MVQTRCFLNARRPWMVLRCVAFALMFAWILFGSYGQRKATGGELTETGRLGDRRLLQSDSTTDSDECSAISRLEHNQSVLCQFITTTGACSNDGGQLDYFHFVYCLMPLDLLPLTMIMLFFWLIFLFIFLGATAEEYFCPALTVISQVLHLSQNVAGVTLLAFGNGAPDIFSALAAINQPNPQRASLAFGALFGAGMFVTTVVVGGVTVSTPFMLTRRPFMRDLIFYLAAVYWTFFILWNNHVTIAISIGYILLYFFYVTIVILGRIVYQKWKKRKLGSGDIPKPVVKPEGQELLSSRSIRAVTHLLPGISGQAYSAIKAPLLDPKSGVAAHNESSRPSPPPLEPVSPPLTGPMLVVTMASPKHLDQNSVSVTNVATAPPPVIQKDKADQDHSQPSTPLPLSDDSSLERSGHEEEKEKGYASSPTLAPVRHHLEVAQQADGTRGLVRSMEGLETGRPTSPSFLATHSRMRKTISSALDITEDVGLAGATPNLTKIWHHSYRKELLHQSTSHPSSPLLRSVSPLLPHTAPNDTSGLMDANVHTPLFQSYDAEGKPQKPRHPFIKLLLALWPFGPAFRSLRIWGKIYEIVKIPASLILTLTVPVVDHDEEDSNWNRWLNILHCVTGPLFICFTTGVGKALIGGVFPVEGVVLILGVTLAIVVAFTSTNDKPPVYHCLFAWGGFAVSVMWIYTVANEIVNLLQVFGIVMSLSDGILGITLLAWGNSIGDAVADITMARQGFPRMAIGACFGGPLLNMLLGIGIAATIKSISQPGLGFDLYFTQVQMFAALFLLFSLASSLVMTSLFRFKMKRAFGIYLFGLYLVFLVVVILAEVQVFKININGVLSPITS